MELPQKNNRNHIEEKISRTQGVDLWMNTSKYTDKIMSVPKYLID